MVAPRAKLRPLSVVLLVAGLGVYAAYFSCTSPMVRNPDAPSHLAYIRFLLEQHALPSASDCSVCHHPPLYYSVAAVVYRAGQALGVDAARALQLLSLAAMAGFGLLAARAFARLFARPYQQHMATALVVLWPFTVVASARVNNDVGFYLVAALCFHFLLCWWQSLEARWLGLAAAAAVLGLFVKANAMTLVVLVVAVATLASVRRPRAGGRRTWLVVGALLLAAGLHGFTRGDTGGTLPRNVLGTAYKTAAAERDPRGLGYYVRFEPRSFVDVPYAETLVPRSYEPTFWNHWLKSSLLGTRTRLFAFLAAPEPASLRPVAKTLNALLMAIVAFGIAGAWLSRREAGPYRELLAVCVGAYVAAAVGFHVLVPTGHHADFRFVYPVLVPAAALFCDVVHGLRRRGLWIWHAGYLLTELVVAFSLAYFVMLVRA